MPPSIGLRTWQCQARPEVARQSPCRSSFAMIAVAVVFLTVSCRGAWAQSTQPTGIEGSHPVSPLPATGDPADQSDRDSTESRPAGGTYFHGGGESRAEAWDQIDSSAARSEALRKIASERWGPNARGGGSLADFDPLMRLITSTIEPDSWEDNGGTGTLVGFPAGVHVDAQGVVRRLRTTSRTRFRESLAAATKPSSASAETTWRAVSLPRWERAVLKALIAGEGPSQIMRRMGGLQRVRWLIVHEETGDLILVGPASDEGPSLSLDAWITVSHNAWHGPGTFGCSIEPRAQQLAATHAFLQTSSTRVIPRHRRDAWTSELRETLGRQDVVVRGIDPQSYTAGIIVAADYHMKCLGMGVEPSIPQVPSYLATLEVGPDGQPPALGVLRWWFTLDYDAIRGDPEGTVFELSGRGAKVLCENEFLSERGERQHTGTAEEGNRAYADRFSRHLEDLAQRFAIYRQLQGVFDLAVVAALAKDDQLPQRVDWTPVLSILPKSPFSRANHAPREVDSIVGQRDLNRRHFVTGISGGVEVDAPAFLAQRRTTADHYQLDEVRTLAVPQKAYSPRSPVWFWELAAPQ
ncbi:MAG TPA: DUF1598 domain-containing protein [Pirellulaceae bacterium]